MNKWDKYFLDICKTVATNSSCYSRKIGAILVDDDNSILCTGYNGPPRGIPHCDQRFKYDQNLRNEMVNNGFLPLEHYGEKSCPRIVLGYKSGQGLHLCIAGHAERNVLINAARNGISTKNKRIFMDCGIPCTPCLIEIINAGIKEIVVTSMTIYDLQCEYLIDNSKLKIRMYK